MCKIRTLIYPIHYLVALSKGHLPIWELKFDQVPFYTCLQVILHHSLMWLHKKFLAHFQGCVDFQVTWFSYFGGNYFTLPIFQCNLCILGLLFVSVAYYKHIIIRPTLAMNFCILIDSQLLDHQHKALCSTFIPHCYIVHVFP
mgnify:CR=1 FL=1